MLSKKFTAVAGASVAEDDYFQNVTMLLSGDGTNGAQNNTFLDSSTNNFTITRNGNTTQGSYSPYGPNWSVFFDNSGDYVDGSVTMLGGASVSTFTIDGWIFPTAFASTIYVIGDMQATGGINYISLNITTGGLIQLEWYDGASKSCTSTGALNLNQWNYFAIRVSSNAITAYVNSATAGQTGTTTLTNRTGTNNFAVGAFNGSATPNAYLSNLRVSTVARTISVPTAAFANDADTRLLMFQSNRFINNGSTTATLTPVGNSSVQRFSPFNPTAPYSTSVIGGSGYFDGNGDYLITPSNAALSPQALAFTMECWAYINVIPGGGSNNGLIFAGTANSLGNCVGILLNGSTGKFAMYDGSTVTVASTTYSTATWYHLALIREGTGSNQTKLYINGALAATTTMSSTFVSPCPVVLGTSTFGYLNNTEYFNGYISDGRFVKNQALATGAFTPPTAPITTNSIGWTGANVAASLTGSVNLLFSTTNAGIYDSAMMNDLETVGGAQISTSVKKYGTGSMAFDGTGDYLKGPISPVNQIGAGDYTFECWLYANSLAGSKAGEQTLITYGTNGFLISIWTGNIHLAQDGVADKTDWASASITNTTWFHLAVSRSGSSTKCFINGVQAGSTYTDSTNYTGSTSVFLGAGVSGGTAFNGYIDDLRISKFARYTANFTPPTAALPNY